MLHDHPGCLACASGSCVAHRDSHGRACEKCRGRGVVTRVDATDPKGERFLEDVCEVCAGVGLVDKKRPAPKPEKPLPVEARPLMSEMLGD